ncbi:MAG TPA: histidine kinase [Steroidobacteraceae bacterium]|jgi:two-component sensor histidine kinase|nr:histidine kinase [Steroidobacteraceae bacterium]
MTATAMSANRIKSRIVRIGGVLDGTLFALGMMLVWLMAYVAEFFFHLLPLVSVRWDFHLAFGFAGEALADMLPMVPLFVIIANRTPPASFARYVWLSAVMAAMSVYWAALAWLWGDTKTLQLWDSGLPACAFESVMVFAAVCFRTSARTATNELAERRKDNAALERELNRARLQLLRAQIEPHFLFNTLATVRALVRLDRAGAIDMLDNLMRYLAEALPTLRRDESLVSEELQLVGAYLRIHQVRMGPRLSFEVLAPDDLGTERIPTMLLLTLVENALKHGIQPAVSGGSIRVSVTRSQTDLVLKVTDSGQGLTVTQGHGMGLANIRRRLSLLYGESAIFSLAPAPSRGMIATVSIPMAATS